MIWFHDGQWISYQILNKKKEFRCEQKQPYKRSISYHHVYSFFGFGGKKLSFTKFDDFIFSLSAAIILSICPARKIYKIISTIIINTAPSTPSSKHCKIHIYRLKRRNFQRLDKVLDCYMLFIGQKFSSHVVHYYSHSPRWYDHVGPHARLVSVGHKGRHFLFFAF